MLTIGLIGGIASGKSTVASLLQEQGALVLDADRFAHEALGQSDIKAALVDAWGEGILSGDGGVDRTALASRVFGKSEKTQSDRCFLEQLVHPYVLTRLREAMAKHEESGGQVAVLDVPLLLEVGWQGECDLVLVVDSPHQARLARVASRGWDAQELANREAAQLPITEKRRRADAVIENGASIEVLRSRVQDFWLRKVAPRLE